MPTSPKSTDGTAPRKPSRPEKPYPEFPLYAHATGRWAKRIRGQIRYFGPWRDPDGALTKFLAQRDALFAGREPRDSTGACTVRDLVNSFLTTKQHLLDSGELSPRTWQDYYATAERLVAQFGATREVCSLEPMDFEELRAALAKRWGPVALGNEINRVRVILKYAADQTLIDKPIHFGQSFKRPSRKTLRAARHAKGKRLFTAPQIRKLLKAAGVQLRAMIYLGINCGLGNQDVARLPQAALDLKRRWLDFPRPKTAVPRLCPLWPETVTAIRAAVKVRPKPRDGKESDLVFLTRQGRPWVRAAIVAAGEGQAPKFATNDAIALEFGKLLRDAKLNRPGLGFYALRHTFETVAGESKDQVAVDAIMGHAPAGEDMGAVYREEVGGKRLAAVIEFVHQWIAAKRVGET